MGALGSALAALQEAMQAQPLDSGYDMAVETLALACYAATQLARQVLADTPCAWVSGNSGPRALSWAAA